VETDREVRNLPGARKAPALKGAIQFRHVDFNYDDRPLTLKDVNLKLEPGQIGALVGPTGSGKTTIASLIARFYEPTGGEILIDGKNVRHYKIKSLRRQISFVLQESLCFARPSGKTSRTVVLRRRDKT
jgi:ABC-type multidrug transport system fused ATPase/permease subunit